MDEKFYWLGFSAAPGIGPVRFDKLISHFGSAKAAWDASGKEKKEVIGDKSAEVLDEFQKTFSFEKYRTQLDEKNVWFVTREDAEYPKLLRNIAKAPFVLYGKGIKALLHTESLYIGVVGTRKITSYGRQVTALLTGDLADRGCVIVSGLALGVDAVAHQTTVAHGGLTIAVLGSGVDVCYPSTNQALYDRIISHGGAVISEYALGVPPSAGSFPARNRIIAGMSHGVLVTEGAEDSGSLITAEDALHFKRHVFAVPGPITSHVSKGPIKLLQKGAVMVTDAKDILEVFGEVAKSSSKKKQIVGDTDEEQKILDLLSHEPLHFDEIVRRMQLDSTKISSILTILEIKGAIENDANGMFDLR